MPHRDNSGDFVVTPRDVVDWIMENRKGNAFRNFPEWRILFDVVESIRNNCIILSLDEAGALHGVIMGYYYKDANTFHVSQVLTNKLECFFGMARRLRNLYPQAKVMARRHNRLVTYQNIDELIRKSGAIKLS